jgi:hypothetical protein
MIAEQGTPGLLPDLSGAELREAELTLANLECANLSGAIFSGANLSRTQLVGDQTPSAKLAQSAIRDFEIVCCLGKVEEPVGVE